MIKLENVYKYYSKNKEDKFYALNSISLEFTKNEFVSILGPSGCGKSTLLNLIGGLDRASEGKIIIDDKDITSFTSKEMDIYKNQSVGFVFQNCFLISQLSVIENIILPLKVRGENEKKIKDKAIELLKKFNIEELKDKKVNQLSGGQAQKICIIRAIIGEPKVILADEPTGALDSKSSKEVMDVLKSISKDHLVIMVTHNEELASTYSNRIIRLLDGKVISDDSINENDLTSLSLYENNKKSKNHLSFLITFKMAIKNLINKKWKSIITSISNSLGVIGIGFFLALNLGFSNYSSRLSREQAMSLPVVLSSYVVNTKTDEFNKVNASIEYPSSQEIYPSVSLSSSYSYKSNKFSNKYFSYLSSLKDEGILSDYILSYGSSYSFNLTTKFPQSIDSKYDEVYQKVDTSTSSYNYYASTASLPTNIFHVLYGDLSSYDLITGKLPTEENELVLVVNKYNAISFNILRKLGFYSSYDKEDDVKTTDDKKVKAISFNDVLNKEYKIFSNNEFYTLSSSYNMSDQLLPERKMDIYSESADLTSLYNDETKGIKLKITGILRPKANVSINILSPALCYLPSLQDKLVSLNEKSTFSSSFKNSYCLKEQIKNGVSLSKDVILTNLLDELSTLYFSYKNDSSNGFPINKFNEIIYKYFTFFVPYKEGYYYTSVTSFLNSSREHSSSLVDESLIDLSMDDSELEMKILSLFKKLDLNDEKSIKKTYDDFLSIISLLNAYSLIDSVVLFPTDLNNRSVLLSKLDSYNVIKENSSSNASNSNEQIFYQNEYDNDMINDIKDAISLTNVILIAVAIISFIVSIFMTAFMITNNVLERQKEIGLLRGIGTSKISIASIFVFESTILGLISGIIGSLVTYIFSFPVNNLINSMYSNYKIGQIACFTFYHALIVILTSLIVSLLASFIPAYLASKNDPIKSLRSE